MSGGDQNSPINNRSPMSNTIPVDIPWCDNILIVSDSTPIANDSLSSMSCELHGDVKTTSPTDEAIHGKGVVAIRKIKKEKQPKNAHIKKLCKSRTLCCKKTDDHTYDTRYSPRYMKNIEKLNKVLQVMSRN